MSDELDALEQTDDDTDQKKPKVPKQYDGKGNFVVRLSVHKVATVREVNGYESIKADKMMGAEPNGAIVTKIYALFGLQSLYIDPAFNDDGTVKLDESGAPSGERASLPPTKNDLEVYSRARLMSGRELMMLMMAYTEEFMTDPTQEGDAVKNSRAPRPSVE